MKDLSKALRQGLERQASSPVEVHPDADLLTAFVEHTISEPERRGLLRHLAICAWCRNVLALALPETEMAALSAVAPAPRPIWRRWLVVRWAAAAVVVMAVAGAVTLYRSQNQPQPMAQIITPATVSQTAANTARESAPAASKPAEAASADVLKTKRETAATPVRELPAPAPVGEREAKSELAMAAPHVALPPATPPPAITAQSRVVEDRPVTPSGATFNAGTGSGAPAASGFAARPGTPLEPSAKDAVAAYNELAGEKSVRAAAPRRGLVTFGPKLDSFVGKNSLTGRPIILETHTMWATTRDGQLQRAGDGFSWQRVEVDPNVVFRSVAQAGSHVWAGGSEGALYHSADEGSSWTRVTVIAADGQILNEDVSGITFREPGTVTVRTISGDVWMTVDGGAHWAIRSR